MKLLIIAVLVTGSLSLNAAGSEPRYNEIFQIDTHNSYWVKRDNVVEAFASGVQERILDQLLIDHARGLEIDIHKDNPHRGNWTVYHTDKQSNSFCSPLAECLKQLKQFHYAVPQHEVVTVIFELKEILEYNFDSGHTPADLDRIFDQQMGNLLYRPRDFLARCTPGSTMRDCARAQGWPTTNELRGKFIFAIIGNWRWCYVGHGASGWAEYATWGGGVRDRSAFPMESNWGDFTREHCGDEYIPADEVQAAKNASLFLQIESYNPGELPAIQDFLSKGGVVRVDNAFSPADQQDRRAHGFQMNQTDYPWLQYDDQGPARPFRPLNTSANVDPRDYAEPGYRLAMNRVWSGTGRGFASRAEFGQVTEWETLPSTTRPTTDGNRPNPHVARGKGCLKATSDNGDSFSVCRQTVDGHWYISKPLGEDIAITVEVSRGGRQYKRTFYSAANWSGGVGDQIRLQVFNTGGGRTCATASSASEIGANGLPAWTALRSECFDGQLPYQGLAADTGDVLFAGTTRTSWAAGAPPQSNYVRASGLNVPDPGRDGYRLEDFSEVHLKRWARPLAVSRFYLPH